MSKYAIIVAGGSGSRMKSEVPKQFLLLAGLPILMHTIRKFKAYQVTVVLPLNQHAYWESLCTEYKFTLPHSIVAGGATRFQSVRNGLINITERGLVAIHDGVRPLIDTETIDRSFIEAEQHGSAVVSIPLKDSIRKMESEKNEARDRSNYRLIQTPQTFDIALVKQAYATEESALFTDDASVIESAGHPIHLIDGSYRNIKITTPEDLKIAQALMQ